MGPVQRFSFAQGLNNARGLKFGSDGNLYVAEGGAGGTSPVPNCAIRFSPSALTRPDTQLSSSKISPDGARTTVIDDCRPIRVPQPKAAS
jgi:hypothetical protein